VNTRDILLEIDDGVAVITLNRPEKRNAFTGLMGQELSRAYRHCDADDEVRALVLTGAAPAFCAGADLGGGAATFEAQDPASFSAAAVDPPAFALRKPVLAAVNGHAIGLGFTLALQCDVRIVARDARYAVVQVRRGVMPDAYAHWTLPRIAGVARAAELLLTGRTIDGPAAVEMGIASRALPADEVLPATLEIAREIATATAPLSAAVAKKLLWESFELTASDVERKETALHHHLMRHPDAIEGVVSFLEKRLPAWTASVANDWPEWPQ
jgi:enoyl-CoA hydratase/carnithine racemase